MSAPIDVTRQPSLSDFPANQIDEAVDDLEFLTGPRATSFPMTDWMYGVVADLVSSASTFPTVS